MQLRINKYTLKKLKQLGLDINDYFSLSCLINNYDVQDHFTLTLDSLKNCNLTNEEGEVTKRGKEVWNLLIDPTTDLSSVANFKEWWDTYPSTDKHSNYPETTKIKTAKLNLLVPYTQNCFNKYKEIIDSGVTHEQLIKALKAEINSKKKNSAKENKLKYMTKPYKYLYNHMYELWLDVEVEEQLENTFGKKIQ